MTTTLTRFTDAYATMTVAIYEPLILRWVSGWSISVATDLIASRVAKTANIDLDGAVSTAGALKLRRAVRLPDSLPEVERETPPVPRPIDPAGRPLQAGDVRRVQLDGFPEAVRVGSRVYPHGIIDASLNVEPEAQRGFFTRLFRAAPGRPQGDARLGARSIPTVINRRLGGLDASPDLHQERHELFQSVFAAAAANVAADDVDFAVAIRQAFTSHTVGKVYEFLPTLEVREALSPIGMAHFYRQLYFNIEEGVGPIEESFTIAPLETLEVMYESVRRQVQEELIEVGSEVVSETAAEMRNLDEVSDKTSTMVQRDTSASMSANASGSIGVWSAGASASTSFAVSSQRGREQATRRLKEITRRASERITKSFTVKTRSLEEVTTTNVTRRVIQNQGDHPVSYGLRRVLRRVHVKVQDLGPRLVWQLYLRNPGTGLARSRFVHFREAQPISVPDVPPGVRPRPKGGTDTGTTTVDLDWDAARQTWYASIRVQTGADRKITGLTIDSVSDLEGGGKDDDAPAPRNQLQWDQGWDDAANAFSVKVGILPGDSEAVSITYTYAYDPSDKLIAEWDTERAAAVNKITEELLTEQFEREKTLITEKSKIRPRPANESRREERYEVMNRMVSDLFGRGDDPSEPSPLEIEYFHRFFDIDAMFVYMHPSWWKPRFTMSAGFPRPEYEITAESDPAPLGSSLGWILQLDGDNRRNEFLNSPWYRICLPIRPQREREAVDWLAKHVEGEVGYDPTAAPLRDLLEAVDKRREAEEGLGLNGPEWVTVDATPGAPAEPLSPQDVYPIIDTFDVTVPTDGFVYDEILIEGNADGNGNGGNGG